MKTTNAAIVSLDGTRVAVWADGGSIWLTRPNRSNPVTLIEVGQYEDEAEDPTKHYVVGGGELVFEIDPIYCTECWNRRWTGDDCELHPSAPVVES